MTILKALKHKSCLSLGTCHKHAVQFTEPTPTIYWHTGIPGLWMQELAAGLWTLDFGRSTLDSRRWTLDAALWTLGSGHRTL